MDYFINLKTKKNKAEKLRILKCKPKSCDFQLKITEPIQENRKEHKVNSKLKIDIQINTTMNMNKNKTQTLMKMKI